MIADLQRQLGIDASFITQSLIFVFVFFWLRFVFFKPYLDLIQRRASQSEGLSDAAAKLEEEAKRAEQEYQDALLHARRRASGEREAILASARKQANDSIAVARAQAKMKLEQSRESSVSFAEAELASLRGQVASVASLLVERLMKTRVGL